LEPDVEHDASREEMTLKGRVFVEVERCVACKRCMLACAVEHSASKDMLTAMTEVPAPRARVKLTSVDGVSVPTECRHCDAAACVAACPTGAVFKDGPHGPVMLKSELCVGCGSCVVACPYGVIRQHYETHEVYKCDLCAERLAAETIPACVEACPTGCLSFQVESELHSWLKDVCAAQAQRIQQHAKIAGDGSEA
jgi:anaerobic carbon-monoxide dehydrogenase iron sulfur subunit